MSELNCYVNLTKNYGHPLPKSVHFENDLGGQNISATPRNHITLRNEKNPLFLEISWNKAFEDLTFETSKMKEISFAIS